MHSATKKRACFISEKGEAYVKDVSPRSPFDGHTRAEAHSLIVRLSAESFSTIPIDTLDTTATCIPLGAASPRAQSAAT